MGEIDTSDADGSKTQNFGVVNQSSSYFIPTHIVCMTTENVYLTNSINSYFYSIQM